MKILNINMSIKSIFVASLLCSSLTMSSHSSTIFPKEGEPDNKKLISASQLDKDEAIKCTRQELMTKEFVVIGDKSFPELLRITFQDLERGSREIILQKKIQNNDEVKFSFPHELVKETAMAVLIIMKGDNMYFKKIDIVDGEE